MSEQVQVPSEEKSFKELYENVCKERSRLQDELQESQRRVNICATERKELRGMYDDMESLSTRLSDKLEQNQNEYSQVIAELQHRLSASEGDLASVKSENAALNQRLGQMEQDKHSLSAEAEKVEGELKRTLEDKLEQNQNGYSQAIVGLHKRLSASEDDLASVKSENAALKKRLEKMKHDKKSLSVEAKNAKAELKKTLEAHLRDERKNSKTFSTLEAQLRQSLVDLSGAKEEKGALDRELGQLQADHRSLKVEIAETREERDGLSRRLELLEGDKSVLEKSKAEMEEQMAKAEEEMEEERSNMDTMILACEESLKAAERERNALLEESGSLRALNAALEQQRDDAEARAAVKADAEKTLSEEKSRLSTLLSGARESLVTMEIKTCALEKSTESQIREIMSRSEAAEKSLEGELLEAIGGLATAEAQKLHLEQSNVVLGERLAESEKQMEKERCEWEEEKTQLIEERLTMEKVTKSLNECLREKIELERKMHTENQELMIQKEELEEFLKATLEENQELMIKQERLEKSLKDTLEVTKVNDNKENIKKTKLHKGSKKNNGLVLDLTRGPCQPHQRPRSRLGRPVAIDP